MSSAKSNNLLAALPSEERRVVLDRCGAVELKAGEVLHHPGDRVAHVYFPIDSIISVHVTADGNHGLELGMVGSEALYGASVALDVAQSPLRASVHCAGKAFRMKAADFVELLQQMPTLRKKVHRYLYAIGVQLAQTAYCTCYHLLESRVACWLLMTHDRSLQNRFQLTHEQLAEMLGVRRSGVSVAAASLQAQQLISYNRGTITVTNRKGLEKASCNCYHHVSDTFQAALA